MHRLRQIARRAVHKGKLLVVQHGVVISALAQPAAERLAELSVDGDLFDVRQDSHPPGESISHRRAGGGRQSAGGKYAIGGFIAEQGQTNLLQIILALPAPSRLAHDCTAGSSIATRMPMTVMTTSNSTSVNPRRSASPLWNLLTALLPYECGRWPAGTSILLPLPPHGKGRRHGDGQQGERPRLGDGRGRTADGASPTALRQ